MAKWRDSLERRFKEWRRLEYAVEDTLAGRRVLRVSGPRTPRLTTPVSVAVKQAELGAVEEKFGAGLACFCLGELTGEERTAFLKAWHDRLESGATVVLADRRGEGCETPDQLRDLLTPHARILNVEVGPTFWWARYERA
ncbi:hypothetical protein [Paenibacillus sacheonensis]|uniref:Uncharacterized protein n=1 Tax=Paenibacillus sacheonensis TaxID=742054 RepID=A0A7X4YRK6_9BACL|nr:hypothetical protein [Paenibacillus sacheonensis]MBM7567635.1 hypothetical protein [Paenibacillus sacheonensis]NBC71262.1 hypothetical protein [Paenibacillus sacheonensis]